MKEAMVPGSSSGLKKGQATRASILRLAVDLASLEGLEGLTIGRLAHEVGMSKSGLFVHFGSKRELQLATVERARTIFLETVVEPSRALPEGLPRLYGMELHWIEYVERSTFKGGCFFAAASAEFDGRPGPVRKRIAALTRYWRDLLEEEARKAQALGHILSDVDSGLIAFQLHSFVQEANWAYQLLGDRQSFQHARAATESMLRAVATPEGIRTTKRRRVVTAREASPAEVDND